MDAVGEDIPEKKHVAHPELKLGAIGFDSVGKPIFEDSLLYNKVGFIGLHIDDLHLSKRQPGKPALVIENDIETQLSMYGYDVRVVGELTSGEPVVVGTHTLTLHKSDDGAPSDIRVRHKDAAYDDDEPDEVVLNAKKSSQFLRGTDPHEELYLMYDEQSKRVVVVTEDLKTFPDNPVETLLRNEKIVSEEDATVEIVKRHAWFSHDDIAWQLDARGDDLSHMQEVYRSTAARGVSYFDRERFGHVYVEPLKDSSVLTQGELLYIAAEDYCLFMEFAARITQKPLNGSTVDERKALYDEAMSMVQREYDTFVQPLDEWETDLIGKPVSGLNLQSHRWGGLRYIIKPSRFGECDSQDATVVSSVSVLSFFRQGYQSRDELIHHLVKVLSHENGHESMSQGQRNNFPYEELFTHALRVGMPIKLTHKEWRLQSTYDEGAQKLLNTVDAMKKLIQSHGGKILVDGVPVDEKTVDRELLLAYANREIHQSSATGPSIDEERGYHIWGFADLHDRLYAHHDPKNKLGGTFANQFAAYANSVYSQKDSERNSKIPQKNMLEVEIANLRKKVLAQKLSS